MGMGLLTREELKNLYETASAPCVSLYVPTHRAGDDVQQDPIRFENTLRAAARDLEAAGLRKPEIDDTLSPARELLDDKMFWKHQDRALVVFLSAGSMKTYRLPLDVRERAYVGDRFYLKPLLSLLSGDGRFHILALSQKRVRLFEATRDSVREVDLRAIPSSLRDAVGYDYEQKSLQFHTGTQRQRGGKRDAMFHGHGAGKETDKEEIVTFFRQVDEGIRALLENSEPLVLAAVDYLIPIYREVSKHQNVLEEGVTGNPDKLEARDLHQKAWKLIEPRFTAETREAAKRFHDMEASGRGSGKIAEVLPAAVEGRVDTLFVARGESRWGQFDRTTGRVEQKHERSPGDEDLLDTVAFTSFLKGAKVYAVEADKVPGDTPVAAIYRY